MEKIFNRILFGVLIIFIATLPISPQITEADTRGGGLIPCVGTENPCCVRDLFVLLHNVVDFGITKLAPIFVVMMLVIGGFHILTSAGNPGRVTKGKDLIKWALIGYAIVLLSWIIINTIFSLIGLANWTGLNKWWEIKL